MRIYSESIVTITHKLITIISVIVVVMSSNVLIITNAIVIVKGILSSSSSLSPYDYHPRIVAIYHYN